MIHGESAVKDQFKHPTYKEELAVKKAEADPPTSTDCPYAAERPFLGMQYTRVCVGVPRKEWSCPVSVYGVKEVYERCDVKRGKDAELSQGKK